MENIRSLIGGVVNRGSPKSKFRSLMEYAAEAKKPIRIIQKMEVAMPSIRIGTFMAVLLYGNRKQLLRGGSGVLLRLHLFQRNDDEFGFGGFGFWFCFFFNLSLRFLWLRLWFLLRLRCFYVFACRRFWRGGGYLYASY